MSSLTVKETFPSCPSKSNVTLQNCVLQEDEFGLVPGSIGPYDFLREISPTVRSCQTESIFNS